MSQMARVSKINKETEEPYEKWVWPAEGKDYSDFRHMEGLLMKLADYMHEAMPETFMEWLMEHQDDCDFADLIIQALPPADALEEAGKNGG